jgi:hypothetical protein
MSYAAALCSFTSYEPRIRKDIIPSGRGRKRTFSFTKSRGLIVEEKGYARGPKRILYLLVMEEKRYALIPMWLCP